MEHLNVFFKIIGESKVFNLFIFIYRNIQYIERDGLEHFHTIKQFPESLSKKITLLKYFRSYMNEHLLKAGADVKPREGDEMTRLPFLKTWFRTRNAMVLQLSNGTLQVGKGEISLVDRILCTSVVIL